MVDSPLWNVHREEAAAITKRSAQLTCERTPKRILMRIRGTVGGEPRLSGLPALRIKGAGLVGCRDRNHGAPCFRVVTIQRGQKASQSPSSCKSVA
jgi:hypothetical protein